MRKASATCDIPNLDSETWSASPCACLRFMIRCKINYSKTLFINSVVIKAKAEYIIHIHTAPHVTTRLHVSVSGIEFIPATWNHKWELTYSKGHTYDPIYCREHGKTLILKRTADKICKGQDTCQYMLDIYYTFGNYRMVRIHGRWHNLYHCSKVSKQRIYRARGGWHDR